MSRKVTQQAVELFLAPDQAVNVHKRFGNTEVAWCDNYTKILMLHGNMIARIEDGVLYITTAGWDTVTTKERLNGLPGVQVYHKNRVLYLNGEPWENHEQWTRIGKVDEL